ncbi:DUF479 domain-containing protein [Bizionia saleffrena]|uniref:DUF479 domain-containing protein n=1 Tax=Bizionia saleffrena TaxID=291189 RepID=A0A8H2QFY7_9FLAO|nr:acyl carrier protein phosphodiesterase [Bizionia saleffrena]TYB77292.1 DUF479 domain-containing protein [Bizionia saleffrena]
MNFLAHIYLSGDNDGVTIGNFIADGIRGKKYRDYPEDIKTGILLHRQIDTFTDAHKTVRLSTKKLHKNYGHYSGIIVDILYDHFLAKNWSRYSNVPLADYVDDFYTLLNNNTEALPTRITNMMPYMMADNWILNYATIEGISQTLEGMNRRTKNKAQMNLAVNELIEFYDEFEEEFTAFFEELIAFSAEQLKRLQE